MMIKYRVTNVAKDFDVPGKRIVAILEEKLGKQVKSQTALEEEDLDVIFEQLTQETELPNFDAYFALQAEKPAAKEEPAPVVESTRGAAVREQTGSSRSCGAEACGKEREKARAPQGAH